MTIFDFIYRGTISEYLLFNYCDFHNKHIWGGFACDGWILPNNSHRARPTHMANVCANHLPHVRCKRRKITKWTIFSSAGAASILLRGSDVWKSVRKAIALDYGQMAYLIDQLKWRIFNWIVDWLMAKNRRKSLSAVHSSLSESIFHAQLRSAFVRHLRPFRLSLVQINGTWSRPHKLA